MASQPSLGGRPPAARLKHRIPVRVRHYWKLLATCGTAAAALVLLAGNVRVTPVVTSQSAGRQDEVVTNIEGTADLFDPSIAHTVTLTYTEADYQRMFDEYMKTGEKEYVRVDITIDGTLIRDAGIRLKGNSTLGTVTHKGQTRSFREGLGGNGGPGGGLTQMPEGGFPGMPGNGQDPGTTPGGQNGPEATRGAGPGGFGGSSLDSSRPEELPWLISFDEFVDGQRYQGTSEIAARISGMGGGSTVLNEAVSLNVINAAGLPTQRYAYTSFQINGRPLKARLLVEHPDENFAGRLGNGVLYKALSTSQFAYQGEDPTSYEDDFKQINNKGSHDLKPVIDLLKWVNEASDTEFNTRLADHVDISSFASYTALQNLLLNFDDMSGPGRNYYLWYDLDTRKFKVISWDHNLTFSGNATAGPSDTMTMGGGRGGLPGAGNGGFQLPQGMQLPEGFTPPEGFAPPGGNGQGGRGPGGMMGGNKLKERFLASEAFKTAYNQAYRDLYNSIYASGTALKALDQITATLAKVTGNDSAALTTDQSRLRSLIEQRTTALAQHEIIVASSSK